MLGSDAMQPAGHRPRNRSPEAPRAGDDTAVHPLLADAFAELTDAGVRWCLLRGRQRLADPGGDVDLLVDPTHRQRCAAALATAGFVVRRRWAAGTQTMYLAYDVPSDRWLHVHAVDTLTFGPNDRFLIPLAREVLSRRDDVGGVPMPDPADRFWLLLLHATLDKDHVAERHRRQLRDLTAAGVTDRQVHDRVRLPGSVRPVDAVRHEHWDEIDRMGGSLRRSLERHDRWSAVRGLRNRTELAVRKLAEAVTDPGLSVALLAPDGAGKSTLARGLAGSLPWRTTVVHLGLYSADDLQSALPGLGFAVRLARAWRRGLTVRWQRARRRAVILDRHPVEALASDGGPVRTRVRNRLLGRSLPTPDLALVLDAPAEVLHQRRPEHGIDELHAARARYGRLARQLPNAAVLDATVPPGEMRRAATARIWQVYRGRRTRR